MRISYWSSDVCSSDLTTIVPNGRCTTCATGSPRSSPHRRPNRYRPDSSIREDAPMAKWECTICGHIYDGALGDPDTGTAAGTRFEDIPEEREHVVEGKRVSVRVEPGGARIIKNKTKKQK